MRHSLALKILLSVLSIVLSYKAALYIAETYFFDKFIYQKNKEYGYWIPGNNYSFKDFLPRTKDILDLLEKEKTVLNETFPTVLGVDTEIFTVALIGDSLVWGQGVKVENTLGRVLEKKLNETRKTKVLSFGVCGDTMLDNYLKFEIVRRAYPIDAYIFVVVDNDLALNSESRYLDKEYNEIVNTCANTYSLEPATFNENNASQEGYEKLLVESYTNPTNLCVLDYIASHSPKSNAMYFIPNNFDENIIPYDVYTSYLRRYGLLTVSANTAKSYPEYEKYWKNPNHYFVVSESEPHPSALANKMYADIISREFINNPKWNFNK